MTDESGPNITETVSLAAKLSSCRDIRNIGLYIVQIAHREFARAMLNSGLQIPHSLHSFHHGASVTASQRNSPRPAGAHRCPWIKGKPGAVGTGPDPLPSSLSLRLQVGMQQHFTIACGGYHGYFTIFTREGRFKKEPRRGAREMCTISCRESYRDWAARMDCVDNLAALITFFNI